MNRIDTAAIARHHEDLVQTCKDSLLAGYPSRDEATRKGSGTTSNPAQGSSLSQGSEVGGSMGASAPATRAADKSVEYPASEQVCANAYLGCTEKVEVAGLCKECREAGEQDDEVPAVNGGRW